jgi:hypothetical protein
MFGLGYQELAVLALIVALFIAILFWLDRSFVSKK